MGPSVARRPTVAIGNACEIRSHRAGVRRHRGQAWRWLERLERAGLVYVTEDPPNAKGIRRKRRWVV